MESNEPVQSEIQENVIPDIRLIQKAHGTPPPGFEEYHQIYKKLNQRFGEFLPISYTQEKDDKFYLLKVERSLKDMRNDLNIQPVYTGRSISNSSDQGDGSPINLGDLSEKYQVNDREKSISIQEDYQKLTEQEKVFLHEIERNIQTFCNHQYYFHVIVLVMKEGPKHHKQKIYQYCFDNRYIFSYDQFGHQVVEACIQSGEEENNEFFVQFADFVLNQEENNFQHLQIHKFGNSVIQTCLDQFQGKDLIQLLLLLKQNLLLTDAEQKLSIAEVTHSSSLFYDDLCSDQYGCLVVQKLVQYYDIQNDTEIKQIVNEQKQIVKMNEMIQQVIENSVDLSKKQFGNYIIQQIIEKGSKEHSQMMAKKFLCPNIDIISKDQYASNVAEKLVGKYWHQCWEELQREDKKQLFEVINDQYGNYVIQRLYQKMDKGEKQEIFEIVNKQYQSNMTCLTDSGICALNQMRNDRNLQPFELQSHLQKQPHTSNSSSSSPVARKNSNKIKSNSQNFEQKNSRNSFNNIPEGHQSSNMNPNSNSYFYPNNSNTSSPTIVQPPSHPMNHNGPNYMHSQPGYLFHQNNHNNYQTNNYSEDYKDSYNYSYPTNYFNNVPNQQPLISPILNPIPVAQNHYIPPYVPYPLNSNFYYGHYESSYHPNH